MPYGSVNEEKSFKKECKLCHCVYWENHWKRDLCPTCNPLWWREYPYVNVSLNRARKKGMKADLTVSQWLMTMFYFKHLCAYCQKRESNVLEHFLPIELGGGTTKSNCVPACGSCNALKRGDHPDQVVKIPRRDMERVQEFLEQFA
jgi:hypothetical protein